MIIEKRQVDGHTVLVVEGVIRLGESAVFLSETLERATESDQGHVILDVARINYIDSTGIGELVGHLAKLHQLGRKLILVRPSPRIVKLLEVARLADQFPVYDSIEAAVEAES